MLLELKDVSKYFRGLAAVWRCNFTVNKGEIVSLIGPNGAGKTTVFNIISGLIRPDSGNIIFNNVDITKLPPYKICMSGIARTYQLTKTFNQMTLLENVMLGALYGSGMKNSMHTASSISSSLIDFVGLGNRKLLLASKVSLVDRKKLEIARALATKPSLLLLDEVMAGLNTAEIEEAMHLIKQIRDSGITIIVVEHVMKAVMNISDRVIVLSAGEIIAEGKPEEIINNKKVIEAYLGD